MLKNACELCHGNGQNLEEIDSAFGTTERRWETCLNCDGEGYINASDEQMVYVNIYSVTREYGGPEEGGWFWNRFVCIESIPTRNKNSDVMKEEMEKAYAHLKHGNIYSVLGGTDIAVHIEEKPKEAETTKRPVYE